MKYIQIDFQKLSEEQKGIIIALLSEQGYDGFDETGEGLKAYIAAARFDEAALHDVIAPFHLLFEKQIIEETNWNQLWESNFEPVIVDNFAAIRAGFHDPIKSVEHEIVITPKMSFGTGHHATTYMMISEIRNLDLENKTVLDFGTGTGVLAILAEKRGAAKVLAVDNDDWSVANADENILNNHCARVTVRKMDKPGEGESYDCILANINRNVLMDFMPQLAQQLLTGGCLVLSGLLTDDEADILSRAGDFGLRLQKRMEKDNWLLLNLAP